MRWREGQIWPYWEKENNHHHHQKLQKNLKHLELGKTKQNKTKAGIWWVEQGRGRAPRWLPPRQRASRCVPNPTPALQAGALRPSKEPPSRDVWTPLHWLPQVSPGRGESGCMPFKSVSRGAHSFMVLLGTGPVVRQY